MTKPLTAKQIQDMDIGQWIWVIDFSTKHGQYVQICSREKGLVFEGKNYNVLPDFSTYGVDWIAYKNKEEAEGLYCKKIRRTKKDKEEIRAEIKKILVSTCKRCRTAQEDYMQDRYAEALANYCLSFKQAQSESYYPTAQMIAEADCNGVCKNCEGRAVCWKETK